MTIKITPLLMILGLYCTTAQCQTLHAHNTDIKPSDSIDAIAKSYEVEPGADDAPELDTAPHINAEINKIPASGGDSIMQIPSHDTRINEPQFSTKTDTKNAACSAWIPQAESLYHIPQGILQSINLVESDGYPWTLNIGGSAYYADNEQDALNHMHTTHGDLRQDMAVGCMQLFTRYHADQFKNPYIMINPRINVLYAGHYLEHLHARYHTWQEAVARYHSPTAEYQRTYLCQVVNRRIRMGYQHINTWYTQTCSGPGAPKMGHNHIHIVNNGY